MSTNPLKTNLVAWWTLDEESGQRNDSFSGNHLTANGSISFDPDGKQDNAAWANNPGNEGRYLTRTDNADLSMGDIDFTIGGWFKPLSLNQFPINQHRLIGKATTLTREYYISISGSKPEIHFSVSADGSSTVTTVSSGVIAAVNTWYFIIAWHNAATNQIFIQVNNAPPVPKAHFGGVFDGAHDFAIGGRHGGTNRFFDGLIDECFVYKRILTSSERMWLWGGSSGRTYSELVAPAAVGTNPGDFALRAWWKMDEDAGENRLNSDPDSGVLTLFDFNGVQAGSVQQRHSIIPNYADFFSGDSDYLRSIDNLGWLSPGDEHFSLGVWMRPGKVELFNQVLGRWSDAGGDAEWILQIANNKARFAVNDGSSNYIADATNFGNLTNGTWYFITATYNATTNAIRVGVNGVYNSVAGPTAINETDTMFFVGSWGDLTNFYAGKMDNLFIYMGRYLTDEEFSWIYNYGHGRRYEDIIEMPPPAIVVDTGVERPIVYVYNEAFEPVGAIDDYYSLNWAERYNELGDFELELPISYLADPLASSHQLITFGNFLYITNSDKIMIIEEIKPETTTDKTSLLVNGRSAESIFERRVLLNPVTWNQGSELLVYALINNHVRNPADADRKIALFDTVETWPPAMLSPTSIEEQFDIQDIYSVVEAVCKRVDFGFKVILDFDNLDLYFYMYEGEDRSIGQIENAWVAFSHDLDNVLDSSFYSSELDKVNVTYVVTGDDVHDQTFVWNGAEPTGINRFEGSLNTTVDRDSDGDGGDDLTDSEILAIIQTRGETVIKEGTPFGIFEGDFVARGTFVYNEDFFMGDIVQCVMHGQDTRARVIELVRSYSTEGEKLYLAFDFLV